MIGKIGGKYYSKPTSDYPFNTNENEQEDLVENNVKEEQKDKNS